MAKIAFLGLGAMGSRMAQQLLTAGHQLSIWNRSAERADVLTKQGASWAESPRAAAYGQEFVFSMLRDDQASYEVWLHDTAGAIHGLSDGAIAVECSTLSPQGFATLAERFSQAGRTIVDAPVAGSRPQADAASLIFFTGAADADFARLEPVLTSMASAVHHVGPMGHGAVIKLAVNAVFAAQLAIMAEILAFLNKQGLPPEKAVEIIAQTPVCSPAAALSAKAMLNKNFQPQFPIELVTKDLGYFLQQKCGNAAVVAAVSQQYQKVKLAGHGSENITAISKLFD